MKKINLGLFGLVIVIVLLLYQNSRITKINEDLLTRVDQIESLLFDIDNDLHEMLEN